MPISNPRATCPYLISVIILLSSFSIPLSAEESTDAEDAPLLQPVTVTEQAERSDTATIVDREEIENKHSTVAFDVLETQPGLHVVRRLGLTGSGLSRLTVRGNGGVGPAGLQVFVDGRPDSTVSFAHPTPSAHGLENAQRIEVIHGPSPVLYGSGKTGVVNITTAPPERGFHGYVEGRYGSFDTTENFARVSYGGQRGYARLNGSYRSTNGDNRDSDAEIKNLDFKAGYQLTDIWDVSFTAGVNEDEFDVLGSFFVPGPFTDPRTESLDLTQTVFDLTFTAVLGDVVSSLLLFYDDLDPTSQILDGSEDRANVNEQGLRFKTTWAATKRTNLIGGIDYLRAKASNSPVLPPFGGPGLSIPRPGIKETLSDLGIYAYADHALTNSISLIGGVRFTDHSEYDSEESGELGVLWRPAGGAANHPLSGTTFRARATRGFQSPTLQQLFGVFRGGQNGPANSELDAEIVEQYEIGVNKTFSRGSFDLVAYIQDGDDLIGAPTTPPPPPPDIQNDVDYKNEGVEATLRFSPTDNWATMLAVTVADYEERFLRAPHNTVDLGITYKHSFKRKHDFSISLFARHADEIFDVAVTPPNSPRIELDDYFVADLKINYRVNKAIRLFLEIDNLTDEDYELVVGIPAPSTSAFVGLALDL